MSLDPATLVASNGGVFQREREWPNVSHAEIVRRSRVLVIDDGDFPYLRLFERDGYTIEQWPEVTNLGSLETGEYDLILLDLMGVGRAESSDEGFGLLKHIRATSPAQIVVAYSNADLSLEYQPFFRDADAVLHKTKADYVEFKRTVDQLLDKRFSLGFYLDRISRELGEHAAAAPKAVDKARSAILTGKVDGLRRYLDKRIEDSVTTDRVIALVGVAAQVAALWTS
jgi:CheY-like chemotaxis protein